MAKNVYIHVPFCKSKCHYCSFVSYANIELKDKYIEALVSQISCEYKGELIQTLYFGGGTPSLLSSEDFEKILNLFKFDTNPEITVEVNPDSVDFKFFSELKALGINRISVGSQTFNDEILKKIGRRHNSLQIVEAVDAAIKAGFENISLDFIYGLPEQDLEGFRADLKKAVNLPVQHVSLYGLKIDEGCYFSKFEPLNIADEDLQADMYLVAINELLEGGFEHYEISNFARKKEGAQDSFYSRHNLNYWICKPYYGFGPAASGYLTGERYTNQTDLAKYIESPLNKIEKNKVPVQEMLEEAIFLGFRKVAGIDVELINEVFGIDFNSKYANILNKYSDYIVKTPCGWKLTTEGILISNDILSEFIAD